MACFKAAVIFGLFLCISACACTTTGSLHISGHETPVYVGLSRLIACEWTGSENITKLEWYLVGLEGLGLGMKLKDTLIVLNPGRVTDLSWNGKMFVCKATLTNGTVVEKKVSLLVKDFDHEIEITSQVDTCDNYTLDGNHTLTCTVMSDLPAKLTWIKIINENPIELENTPNITVSTEKKVSEKIKTRSITFHPLLTLHAGKYKCVSILHNMGPKLLSTKELEHKFYVKLPLPTVELISGNEAVTSKNFSLTALINVHPEVDVPVDIDSNWYGQDSLNASRVTIINSKSSSVVQFAPLISSDEGIYSFSTRVRAIDSKYLCPSSLVTDSIDISPSLFVAIDVTCTSPAGFNLKSPPYYKTNTDVTFICRVEGAHGNITYQWSSTAMEKLPADSNSQNLTIHMVNSYDDGNYTCNVTDAKGNTGSDTTEVEVIGLNVSIQVDYNLPAYGNCSPPYFRSATFVTLTCQVTGAKGKFQYLWRSTNPNSFVLNDRSSNLARAILTSDDAGNHTCIVMDDDNNTGSSTIEMKTEGGGIFVLKSKSHTYMPVVNNSMITIDSRSRIIDFICYSDSSDSDDWYIILPNKTEYKKSQQVRGISPSGIQFQNNNTRLRVNTGIYTCRLRYSNGTNISYNLGVYTSTRGSAPYIYYSRYIDHSKNESNTLLGEIEIKTRNAPPTNVTCKRYGEKVVSYPCMKKDGYEVMQVVTDRSRSYYTTYIQITNCCDLVGRNEYICTVENSAGRHSRTIPTIMEVETDLSLKNTTEPVYNETFVLTCTATITPRKPARCLFQETQIEWVGPDGNVSKNSSGIIVGDQVKINETTATRTLKFSSLNYGHEEVYTCRTKCVESIPQSFTIKIIERTILQLKFGPLPHCSNWYKEKRISAHVEHDLTKAIERILLKDCDNSCTLHHQLLTEQRFSCQTSTSCVTFRAYLIGSNETRSLRDMLYALDQWLVNDGTFVYNYNSRIRLRADHECPLTIDSFCEPECKGRECLFRKGTNIPTVERHPYVHLFG